MENEQICRNCEHYIRTFIKKSTYFKPNGGFCVLRKGKFISPMDKACDKWEQNKENREEGLKALKERLADICDRLEQLIQIMGEDQ